MVKGAVRYEPGPAFQETGEQDTLEISPSDSTELWLIQWPINHVDASDFHGNEVSLNLRNDGNLGELECSSGKSYELVSFAAQQPDATVFIPSGSEMKAVGKISRRVCLVHYPETQELEKEKPGFGSRTPSSRRSAGTSRKTMSRFTSASKNRSSQGSAFSLGEHSAEPASIHKKKRRDESSLGHSGKSSHGSQAHGTESNTSFETPQKSVEKSKKKKKVRIAE